jgi:hypothetical protein
MRDIPSHLVAAALCNTEFAKDYKNKMRRSRIIRIPIIAAAIAVAVMIVFLP